MAWNIVYRGPAYFAWDAPSGGAAATSYKLYWGTTQGVYPNSATDTGFDGVEAWSVLGLAGNTTYYVVVRAVNGSGESGNSNEIQVRDGVQIGP